MFALVDRFHGRRLGLDAEALEPGRTAVVESVRRLGKEQSYGYVRALWWLWWEDGRSAVSVPPGTADAVREAIGDVRSADELLDAALAERLKPPVNAALARVGLEAVDRVWVDLTFACDASLLRRHRHGDCRRLTDAGIPAAEGIELPAHCFPDGIAYGVVADGRVASTAYAHRTGVMEGVVADLGVETAAAYRRRGYAQTCVSAVVEHVTRTGGEARYGCAPTNAGSIATARSVGFVPYANSLVLAAPWPAQEEEPP